MSEKLSSQAHATKAGLELAYQANEAFDEIRHATELHRNLVEAASALIGSSAIGAEGVTQTANAEVMTEKSHEIRKAVREQLKTALAAGNEVAGILKAETMTEAEFGAFVELQFVDWEANGTFDYFEKNSLTPNLIATPNTLVDAKGIIKLGKKFGEDQPYKTTIYPDLYQQYSKEELSGMLSDSTFRLSLVPDQFSEELGEKDVATQRVALKKVQADNPELGLHSLSPLEAQAYLFARRAAGKENGYESTYVRSIELPEKRLDGWSLVPFADVSDDGEAILYDSGVGSGLGARLAVGKNLSS